jgi:hypothetical protein
MRTFKVFIEHLFCYLGHNYYKYIKLTQWPTLSVGQFLNYYKKMNTPAAEVSVRGRKRDLMSPACVAEASCGDEPCARLRTHTRCAWAWVILRGVFRRLLFPCTSVPPSYSPWWKLALTPWAVGLMLCGYQHYHFEHFTR